MTKNSLEGAAAIVATYRRLDNVDAVARPTITFIEPVRDLQPGHSPYFEAQIGTFRSDPFDRPADALDDLLRVVRDAARAQAERFERKAVALRSSL